MRLRRVARWSRDDGEVRDAKVQGPRVPAAEGGRVTLLAFLLASLALDGLVLAMLAAIGGGE